MPGIGLERWSDARYCQNAALTLVSQVLTMAAASSDRAAATASGASRPIAQTDCDLVLADHRNAGAAEGGPALLVNRPMPQRALSSRRGSSEQLHEARGPGLPWRRRQVHTGKSKD